MRKNEWFLMLYTNVGKFSQILCVKRQIIYMMDGHKSDISVCYFSIVETRDVNIFSHTFSIICKVFHSTEINQF